MTEDEAVTHVESLAILGMRFGLDRMRRLLDVLGHPQLGRPAVHVVGSNGKTSTTRLTAAALRAEGLRVGAYLSPHVRGWNERIEIDGAQVTAAAFAAAITAVAAAARRLAPPPGGEVTQFETLTAAAFWLFARERVDAMVVEAGLGGRYDATNMLPDRRSTGPRGAVAARPVVALTSVSLEHTALLGDTERAIAQEKLSVCADGFERLIVGRLGPVASGAVDGLLAERRLRAWRYGRDLRADLEPGGTLAITTPGARYERLALGPAGAFQRTNAAVAVAAAERLLGRPPDVERLRGALAAVRVPGRMERLPGAPPVLLDGAHNPEGMAALVESLAAEPGGPPVAVMSVLDDKDLDAMMASLSGTARAVVATRSAHPRAVPPERIAACAARRGLPAEAVADPHAALARARHLAGPGGLVVVCGSLYLLADLRPGLTSSVGGRW